MHGGPAAADDARWRRLAVWLPVALAVAVAAAALGNGFVYDDRAIVETNVRLTAPSRWWEAIATPWWLAQGTLWRPVTQAMLAPLYWIGDGSPLPFRLVLLALHALTTGLLARLALRLTASSPAALAAALLFAAHPVHVESIGAVVGLADVLSALGLVLVALVALRPVAVWRRGDGWLLMAATVVAMGAKENGVVAPAIAWLAARHVTDATAAIRRSGWAIAGVCVLLAGRLLVLGTLTGDEPHPAWVGLAPWPSLQLALRTLAVGFGWLVVPRPPQFDHAPTNAVIADPGFGWVLAGCALVAVGLWAFARHWRRPTAATFGLLWWGAAILPTSNLLFRSGIVLVDRTQYAPSIGVVLLAAAGIAALVSAPTWRLATTSSAAALACWGLVQSWRDLPRWRDNEALGALFVERAPTSFMSWLFQGRNLLDAHRDAEARAAFDRGLAQFDGDARLLQDRARFAIREGDTALAVRLLERAVQQRPVTNTARQLLLDLYRRDPARGADYRRLVEEGVRLAPDQRRWRAALDSLRRLPADPS
jgi:hypothetical protein